MLGQSLATFPPTEVAQRNKGDSWRKRGRVLQRLEDFDRELSATHAKADVARLVGDVLECLSREQAGPRDEMYLRRSITRVATAVRRGGWPAIAAQTLEQAIESGLADEYVYAEAILNRLMLNQWATAEQLMHEARVRGASSPTAYSSMLTIYARHGWTEKCLEFFEHANRDGMVTDECCGALIKSYGKGGHVDRAESVFRQAVEAGVAGCETFVSLVNTYAHASRCVDARIAFESAGARGIADPRLFTGLILAYCKAGFGGEAERAWQAALEQGYLSDMTVAVLVDWYAQRGHFRRAEKLLRRAEAASVPGDAGHLALASAYQRTGHFSAARRIRRHARTRTTGPGSSWMADRLRPHVRRQPAARHTPEDTTHALADTR